MSIKLRNRDVFAALSALENLNKADASGSFKLKLARIGAVLRREAELIQSTAKEIHDAHIVKDSEGRPVPRMVGSKPIEGTVTFKDEKAYEAAAKELDEAEVELEVLTLNSKEIEGLQFSGSIEGLLPLIAD